jgi:hypothetical protein
MSNEKGFFSYFHKNGYGDRAFYDKKGHWVYSLILFGEDKLPRDVRATIKSAYFDMAIKLVEEVQTSDGHVYIVHLEDQSGFRVIKINDECEYEILQDLLK